MLFCQDREDEVVVCDGQELVLPLRAVHEPLAGEPAGADGHPRLNRLVTRAPRVLLGVEENHDPRFLILLEREVPGNRRQQDGDAERDPDESQPQPGQIRDTETDGNQRRGCAEVGLLRDQQKRHGGKEAGNHQIAGRSRATTILAEEHGENQRQGHTRELRRLELETPNLDPALRAASAVAADEHEYQHGDQAAVEKQRVLGQLAIVDHQADQQRDPADTERVDLREELTPGTPAAIRQTDVGRAVDHGEADACQHHHGCQEQPVDVKIETAFEH